MFLISLILVIFGGVSYELIADYAPKKENHFFYLVITYISAFALVIIYLLVTGYNFNNISSDISIFSFLVGASAMFSDYGLIQAYNYGWKLGKLNITYAIFVFLILLIIGLMFYNEKISDLKGIGIILCITSLFLMNYKKKRG